MKKTVMIACLMGLLWVPSVVQAAPFPDKTDAVVQDDANYVKKEDRQKFAETIKKFPDQYKVVVVESTQPEAANADEYAHKLYDKYNLPENSMVIVLDIDTEQVGVYAGEGMQQKGAKLEMLHDKLTSYYEPYRNQKQYIKGIELFIQEVNAEMERIGATPKTPVGETAAPVTAAPKDKSFLASIPWWLYAIAIVFVVAIVGMVYIMIRRRTIFSEVDEVEDWKDELVEKIQTIDFEKSLRKSTGVTEERYAMLADRKENMLRVRIPDVEMIILESEDVCDRFRFQAARSLLAEGREILTEIEAELKELKNDTTKVVHTKKESKQVIPEITKLVETVERKLTNFRLDYGLSFHELKVQLDDVDKLRSEVKSDLASGDDVKAYDKTLQAQQILEKLARLLELIPALVARVQKELPEELKQLEQDISLAVGDGYDLNESSLDSGLLQTRQLLQSAKSSLEEGDIALTETHVKAFEVQVDHIYQVMEESVLATKKQVAAATAINTSIVEEELESVDVVGVDTEAGASSETEFSSETETDVCSETKTETEAETEAETEVENTILEVEAEQATQAEELPQENEQQEELKHQEDAHVVSETMSQEERYFLLKQEHVAESHQQNDEKADKEQDEMAKVKFNVPVIDARGQVDDEEYELVMPKQASSEQQAEIELAESHELFLETEEDVLDEMERISGALVRIRQQIKRSYLPGIPSDLKLLFDQVVQALGRVQIAMEKYNYSLEEVSYLLEEANESLMATEKMAAQVISYSQKAEGAIQYTNRYRRQNRQVNDLLTKAEASFRQLRFNEALLLAEEARLIIEGEPEEGVTTSRWLLRKKKKETQR